MIRKLLFALVLLAYAPLGWAQTNINNGGGGGAPSGPAGSLVTVTSGSFGVATGWTYTGGILGGLNTGTYNGASIYYPFLSDVEPSSTPCPVSSLFNGSIHTVAGLFCITTPTSGTTNGASVAVQGGVQVNDPNTGPCEFSSRCYGIPFYAACNTNANSTECEGLDTTVSSTAGKTNNWLYGAELSVFPANTSDQGAGLIVDMLGANVQPAGSWSGVWLNPPTGTGLWNVGFNSDNFSVKTSNTYVAPGLRLGVRFNQASSNSQSLQFDYFSSTSSTLHLYQTVFPDASNNPEVTWEIGSTSFAYSAVLPSSGSTGWSGVNVLSFGSIAISSATSASHTFTNAYASAPYCQITPVGDPTTVGVYWATSTTTTVTANVKVSGTLTFNFVCGPAAN